MQFGRAIYCVPSSLNSLNVFIVGFGCLLKISCEQASRGNGYASFACPFDVLIFDGRPDRGQVFIDLFDFPGDILAFSECCVPRVVDVVIAGVELDLAPCVHEVAQLVVRFCVTLGKHFIPGAVHVQRWRGQVHGATLITSHNEPRRICAVESASFWFPARISIRCQSPRADL